MTTMDEAWAEFDKAAKFDEKAAELEGQEGKENLARTSRRAADRKLDLACKLEEEALAAGERHAA